MFGIKKTKIHLQKNPVECGAICLSIIFEYLNLPYNLNELKKDMSLSSMGCSAFDLVTTAKKFGLTVSSKNLLPSDIKKCNNLQILFFSNHFVVYEGYFNGKYYINDPALGRYCLSEHDFRQQYKNLSIVVFNRPVFKIFINSNISALFFSFINGLLFGACFFIPIFLLGKLILTFYLKNNISYELVSYLFVSLLVMILLFYTYNLLVDKKNNIKFDSWFKKLFSKIKKLPPNFFDFLSNEAFSLEASDSCSDYFNIKKSINNLCFSLGFFLVLLISVLIISPKLFFLIFLTSVIMFFLLTIFRDKIYQYLNFLEQSTNNFKNNYDFNFQSYEQNYSEQTIKINALMRDEINFLSSQFYNKIILLSFSNFDIVFFFLNLLLVYFIGHGEVALGKISLAEFFSLMLITPYLPNFYSSYFNYLINKNKLDKIYFLSKHVELYENISFKFKEEKNNCLMSINEVTYKNDEDSLIEYNNFDIEKGKIYALVSEKYHDKSILLKILANEYPVTSGHVVVNINKEKYKFSLIDNRQNIFEGSLLDNICLTENNIDEKKISNCLHETLLNEIYYNRPLGLLTHIRDEGKNLSFGQCKRLMLARSFYHQVDLLLLDEFFISQDEETAIKIIKTIKSKNITCIFTSLNEKYISLADEVIYLSQKNNIEKNDHSVLKKNNLDYQKIFFK